MLQIQCIWKKSNTISKFAKSQQKLRMKCSKLFFHVFSLHVVDSPACPCGNYCDDSNHYLLQCPLFYQGRNIMMNEIGTLTTTDISCDLLYGSVELELSKSVFDAVHRFIDDTDRLQFVIFTCEPYCYFMIIWVLLNILFLTVLWMCVCMCG